jgi:hypothetical protein
MKTSGGRVIAQHEQHDGEGRRSTRERHLLVALGSRWFAALLPMLLLVAMACATVFESLHGTEQALGHFYKSRWFELLLVLMGVSVLAALVVRYPFSKRQLGFVLAHAGILLTLFGAAVTKLWGIDGRVGVLQGQAVDHFRIPQDTLTIANLGNQTSSTTELTGSVFGPLRVVETPAVEPLVLDDVRVEIKRYLPDGIWSREVFEEDLPGPPAIEVSLSESGRDDPVWLVAGETTALGSKEVAFSVVSGSDVLDRILEGQPASDPAAENIVRVEHTGLTFNIPLTDCTARAVPLGDTGYTLRVLRYLPHAFVGPDNRITNASDRPVNPAIEAELTGPEGSETRLAFARFPGFRARHDSVRNEAFALTFVAKRTNVPTAAIEVFGAPGGDTCVRFSWEGARPVNRKLTVGAPVESPWPDLKFTVLRRFEHARTKWSVAPADPIRKIRKPMMLVGWQRGEDGGEAWLNKYDPQPLPGDGPAYELTYGDKTMPLGFLLALDRFRVRYYPGSDRPRSFESHVTLTDSTTGESRSKIISMNAPVQFGRYSLFQSSYRSDGRGTVSFLSVSRDPGRAIVFAGYIAMLAGMILDVGTRTAGRRKKRLERGPAVNPADA